MAINDPLDLVEIFYAKTAREWYDYNNTKREGAGLFNALAENYGVPKCEVFSGGVQIAKGGTVGMFAIDPVGRTGGYGINDSRNFSGALLVQLMLPSGAYGREAWKQRKAYDKILRTCLEQAFGQPEPCLSRFFIEDISIEYLTKGGEEFNPFDAINKVEEKKLAASLSVQAADWIGE